MSAHTRHLSPVWSRITDIRVERGEGAYVTDVNGVRYLDFTCGIGVTNTGHCHPRVVEAAREQTGKIIHAQVNILYPSPCCDWQRRFARSRPRR